MTKTALLLLGFSLVGILAFTACTTGGVGTPTLDSQSPASLVSYTSKLNNYRFLYPATFTVTYEHQLADVYSSVEFLGPLRGAESTEEVWGGRVYFAVSFESKYARTGLLDDVPSSDSFYGTEWNETKVGGQRAYVLDRSLEGELGRLLWVPRNGDTYVIDLWYPKDDPQAQEEGELIWQTVLDSFEFTP